MINIVRGTLMLNATTETAEGRKILYVNLEMNFRQILTNLVLVMYLWVCNTRRAYKTVAIKKS
jgi:hypothetical protein